MRIQLSLGKDYDRTVKELGEMGRNIQKAAAVGLTDAAKFAASHVVETQLTGQKLKRRTGHLAEALDGWSVAPDDALVGTREDAAVNSYAYLLSKQTKTITPKKAKFLTIPIGENLTGAGVARFSSPRQVPDGFFIQSKGQCLFGYKKGKKGKFRPLFVLKKSVTSSPVRLLVTLKYISFIPSVPYSAISSGVRSGLSALKPLRVLVFT